MQCALPRSGRSTALSDTPRTDQATFTTDYVPDTPWVLASFARKLERELSAALKAREKAERDAQRYRWLRKDANSDDVMVYACEGDPTTMYLPEKERLDAAIDEAMKK